MAIQDDIIILLCSNLGHIVVKLLMV